MNMTRKLVLTPFEGAGLNFYQSFFRLLATMTNKQPIDMTHLLLSALTMTGVDKIYSMERDDSAIISLNTSTTLIRKIAPKVSLKKWEQNLTKVNDVFSNYKSLGISKKTEYIIDYLSYVIASLLYAMKTNSSALFLFGLNPDSKNQEIPAELQAPIMQMFSSIETKNVKSPVIKNELQKRDVKKLMDVLQSKNFAFYKKAQSEIENNAKFSDKIVKQIERAGKDLIRNNRELFFLKDNVIKVIPLSAKVVDLFFGKLPGILSSYATSILEDFLRDSKTIPVYNCETIISEQFHKILSNPHPDSILARRLELNK